MASPKRLAPFIIAISFLLLMMGGTNSASSTSCTDDCAPFIPGTVAYWPLTSETKGSDMSGNGNHASLVGVTYTIGPTGEPNRAVHFQGNKNSYSWIPMSPSLDVGKYPGFSFCGFVRLSVNQNFAFIDWRDNSIDGGVHVWAWPAQALFIHMYTSHTAIKRKYVRFPNMKLVTGSWQFFGLSYEKATGKVTAFIDGKKELKQLDKNIVAENNTTKRVGLGIRLNDMHYFNGDMSCMMLFKVALTADDFERVRRFCRTEKLTQEALPNITVSDIKTSTATVSWTESSGAFSRYSITIERNGSRLAEEIVYPKYLDPSVRFPSAIMVNLIPGATYRVHVWHMMGVIKGRARTSTWFDTKPVFLLPESITVTMITATSAHVIWKEEAGVFDSYYVVISPTTGGAMADPSTVPRGTTTTSLKNLSPASHYTIAISTKIYPGTGSPSLKSFQTPALNNTIETTDTPQIEPSIAVIGFVVAVICLVLMVIGIAVIVILFRRRNSLFTNNGDARSLPMSNLGFQQDDPSTSKTQIHGECDRYEVLDRSKFEGNAGSRQVPHHKSVEDSKGTTTDGVYENLSN